VEAAVPVGLGPDSSCSPLPPFPELVVQALQQEQPVAPEPRWQKSQVASRLEEERALWAPA